MHRLALLLSLVACSESQPGGKPIGGMVDTDAAIQRYLRHATLDLAGHVPADADLATSTAQLRDQGNTAAARGAFVDGLLGQDTYPKVWVEELENAIFGGNTLDSQYALVCGIIRGSTQDCLSCTATDSCACSCPEIAPLLAERTQLETSTADFTAGTASSTIERRYAMAEGYYALSGSPEGRVKALFTDFLGRDAETDEIENGRAMVFGSIIPPSPAGLLFHRYGGNYADLIDIIFTSEVYRESLVRRVFERYLSREPSTVELVHFVSTLDANAPDVHGLVHAVVSSREYFDQ